MNQWLANATKDKKASPEKLAATQVMLSCKPYKMTIDTIIILTWLARFVYQKIKEDMLNYETSYSKSVSW